MENKSDAKAAALESVETVDVQNHRQALADESFTRLWQRCLELARQDRQEDLKAMLRRYGVERLTELPKEKYGEVLKELERW